MSIFDTLKNSLGGLTGSVSASALPGLVNQFYPGGLPGLLGKLQQTGYGQQVNSWLGRGPNDPITAEDLRSALGNEHVQEMERRLGIPADQVLDTLSKLLPDAVDQHSPDGHLTNEAKP